jgi:tetratricopeptide (TPR) repeat protein
MGKSRLTFEIQNRLQAEGQILWLTGQTDALNHVPFRAFSYFLRPYFGQNRERDTTANLAAFDARFEDLLTLASEDSRADLLLYRSYLAGIVGLSIPGSAYETADEKQRIDAGLTVLKAWIRAESRRQPIVLHLEDAQWLDPISIRAVQDLTYNIETVPLALLLTSRYNDDKTPFTIPNIFSVPVQSIELDRLSSEGVREIAVAVLGSEVSETLAAFIRERAEGNPFFTEQFALDLRERGALIEQPGGWTIHPDSAAEVPSNVNAILIARLDRLSSQVKVVVQTAAVLGREFDVEVLSRMLRESERLYIQVAESEAIWSALTTLRYLFRHALLRDAAYQMQVQERIRVLHQLAAETIEQLYPDDATWHDVLLEHWYEAGNIEQQLRYLDPVAERLIRITAAYDRAKELLERSLKQLEASDKRRAALFNWIGLAHLQQNNFAEVRSAVTQVHSLISSDDKAELANSLYLLGTISTRESKFDEARSYIEQSLELTREIGDRPGTSRNLHMIATTLQTQGAYAEARPYLEQALALQREIGDQLWLAKSLGTLGSNARFQGNYTDANIYLEQTLAIQRELGDRYGIGNSLVEMGITARLQGNYGKAREYLEQGLAMRRDIGDRLGAANALISLGNIAFTLGEYSQARARYEQSLATLREVGSPAGIAGTLNNLGVVSVLQRDYAAAEIYHQEGLMMRRRIGDRRGIADSLMNIGALAFRQKDYQAAESYFRESLVLHRDLNDGFIYSSQGWMGRVQARLGQIEEAWNSLRKAFKALLTDDAGHKLTLLVLAAEIYWLQDNFEAAAEIAGLLLSHPSTEAESREDTEAVLTEIRSHLDSSILNAALERGKSADVAQMVNQILTDLG